VVNRYFAASPGRPRVRRAHDVVPIATGALVLVWTAGNIGDPGSTSNHWILTLIDPLPHSWWQQIWVVGYLVGLVVVIGFATAAIATRRWGLLRDLAVAIAGAVALSLLLGYWIGDGLPVILPELGGRGAAPAFPIIRVAVTTAAVMVVSPHVTRPLRILGWASVAIVAFSGFGLDYGLPSDAIGAIAIGMVAAGATLLLFGSPLGYPDVNEIHAALRALGVEVSHLAVVSDRSPGVRSASGRLQDGRPVRIVAYARDAADDRFASRLWRRTWHGQGSSTEAVEHEALVALYARGRGVNTPEPLAMGAADDEVAILVTTAEGTPLDGASDHLVAAWREVSTLHSIGIAHGALRRSAVAVDDRRAILSDLAAATFDAGDGRRCRDVSSLLYESAVIAGPRAAVDAASRVLADEQLVDALRYLQPPSLTAEQQQAVADPQRLLAAIGDAIVDKTGVERPEPSTLHRFRLRDLVVPALSLLAFYLLIRALTTIDSAVVLEKLGTATGEVIVIGFAVGQIAVLFEAAAMRSATGYAFPLQPLALLEFAIKWISLAVPSVAGRVQMNTRFLRRCGVPPRVADGQGGVDSLSALIVDAIILIVAFVFTDIQLDTGTGDSGWGLLLLIAALIVGAGLMAVWSIRRLRDLVVSVTGAALRSLASVLRSPTRTLGLFLGILAGRVALASALWLFLHAVGVSLPLHTCLVITVITGLFAGLVLIPGGVGVAVAVLTSLLVFAGLEPNTAFAIAGVYRIATFYVPAGEGFFATSRLEHRGYL
jgi:glycosyltransferase 2 family protein